MSVAGEQDAPQLPAAPDPGFRDALTFAFGDPVAKLYGHARIGLGADGASGLALLFAGSEIAAASSASGVSVADGAAALLFGGSGANTATTAGATNGSGSARLHFGPATLPPDLHAALQADPSRC